jgi:hypothetical protein
LKTIFLLAASFILVSCKFDAIGLTPAFIYPKENIASVRKITKSCPVEVSEPTEVSLKELTGWVCIPPDQVQKIRRAHEKECEKSLQAAPPEVNTANFMEELDVNTKLWVPETAD